MKILLHICCAPCAIYPVKQLREKNCQVMGYFYRHNIHPYTECLKRQGTLEKYSESIDLNIIYQKDYKMEKFIQNVAFRESNRCEFCYYDRLKSTARAAKKGKFDYFSTTLLYSKFQKHEMIQSIGDSVAQIVGVPFYYEDFRPGWKQGIEESKELGLYRQPYCGCIYSEKERYFKQNSTTSTRP